MTYALDEFRLSTTARYTAAFTPTIHLEPDAGTLVLWSLDEGTGTTSVDRSGHGYNAQLGGGPVGGGAPGWAPPGR